MTKAPLVSVVIATRDSAAHLADCLESVAAQTFVDYEIIVVDGHSTDATEAIARSYSRVRFFQQTGTGFANAWNCGLRQASGEFIAFIDSDDRWTPHKLAHQLVLLQGNPRFEAVVGKVRFFLGKGDVPPRTFKTGLLDRDHIAHMPGALLARRRLFEAMGDWGERWAIASDIDWFVKLRDAGVPIGVLNEVVLHKRVHGRNLSYLTAEDPVYPRELLSLLHDSIARKRAAG